MDFDNDDDDRGVGSSTAANAGFGPSDEPVVDLALDNDEELDLSGADRRIWLVKVPKFLLEKWQNVKQDGVELGRLRIYNKPMPDGQERIAVLLPPIAQGEEEIPLEYSMTIQNKATKNTYIFAEREDVSIGEAGWEPGRGRIRPEEDEEGRMINKAPAKKRRPRLTGTVNHECNLTPRLDSASYRSIVRNRQAKAAEPKRKLVRIEGEGQEHTRLGIAGMSTRKFDTFIRGKEKAKTEPSDRLTRIPRNELLDMLFSAFELYDYWNMKNLKAHTRQPEVYLREVLSDIATLNKRGPYAGMYSLQDQFRRGKAKKEEGGGDGDTPGASGSGPGGSGGAGAKEEEDDALDDVKPSLSDVEDDDDMEEVA